MKRTLLASAFAVMALAASAQISEVTKVKGDGFDFIPKSLTTTGVITPYSTIGVEYHWGSNQIPEFTVYDASFNVEKTFKYDPMVFKSNLVPMRALADFKTKKVIKEGYEEAYWGHRVDGVYGYDGFETPITNMDEFKAAVTKLIGDVGQVYFTDYKGNFAYHAAKGWQDASGSYDSICVSERYSFYNPSDNKLYNVDGLTKLVEVDMSKLAWKVDDSLEGREVIQQESIIPTEVYDYDANCNEDTYGYLTQNVFNNDDKYEFLAICYRQVSPPETTVYGSMINGIENGKVVFSQDVQDKYYESYIAVKNEEGKELFTIPNCDNGKGLSIYRMNGKTYIENNESLGNGETQYVIYLLDNTGTGITELARTNVVKSAKTFNMAGMKVGKNAKGIVIQQGGKKYFNK